MLFLIGQQYHHKLLGSLFNVYNNLYFNDQIKAVQRTKAAVQEVKLQMAKNLTW